LHYFTRGSERERSNLHTGYMLERLTSKRFLSERVLEDMFHTKNGGWTKNSI